MGDEGLFDWVPNSVLFSVKLLAKTFPWGWSERGTGQVERQPDRE